MPPLCFRYRAFLSKEQLDDLVKPSPDTLQLVSAWLAHHGIPSSSISTIYGGNWLTVTDVGLSQANQLLGASYRLYRNIKTNETIIRTVDYLLPAVLHTHIQTVTPTTCFSSMQVTLQSPHRRPFGPAPARAQTVSEKLGTRLQPPPPPPVVQPENLRWMYGTSEYQPTAYGPGRNRLGIVGFQRPIRDDLTDFMVAYRGEAVDATFTLIYMDYPLGNPGWTSSVVVQYASAMAYPTPLFYYGVMINENSLTRFLSFLLAQPYIIQTIGMSYNYFLEPVLPPELADSLCDQFARLGTRGSSVLVASGNSGVGAGACEDGEGQVKFVVEFPSSCTSGFLSPLPTKTQTQVQFSHQRRGFTGPFITSVGGTQYHNPEVADGRSGGGFSTHHGRPSYQDNAVLEFFAEIGDLNSGYYKCALFRDSDLFLLS